MNADGVEHADTVDMDRVAGRIAACQEDAAARPYSSPVAVGWYAQDVPALLALAERADTLERGPCRCDKCRDCVAADGYEAALERAEAAEADRGRLARRVAKLEADAAELRRAYWQACTNLATIRPDLSRDLSIGETARLYHDALIAGWGGIEGYDPDVLAGNGGGA